MSKDSKSRKSLSKESLGRKSVSISKDSKSRKSVSISKDSKSRKSIIKGRKSVAVSKFDSKNLVKDMNVTSSSKKYNARKSVVSTSHSREKLESSNEDLKKRKSIHHDTHGTHKSSKHLKDKQPQNLDYLKDDKLYWEEFPELNYARNYSCFYIHNDYYLYVFFGYNQYRGNLDTIEKIDLREPENKWQIIKYQNPSKLDLHLASMSVCYAGVDEIYILGGSIHDTPTDQIIKYNFKQNAFFLTEMTIPGMRENDYFRFWEESSFVPLTSKGNATNADDEFTFGLIDARDKVHLFNIRNFKYNII
jgi:hypothetical protein